MPAHCHALLVRTLLLGSLKFSTLNRMFGGWREARLACFAGAVDPTNENVWGHAFELPNDTQPRHENFQSVGSIGPQQMMLDRSIHPWIEPGMVASWVPDLLGEEWIHDNATLLVGSAPAGFIAGYSGRQRAMRLQDYLRANDWKEFQRSFFQQVVLDDENHYERLSPLIDHKSRFAVFDLCRASLVVRGALTTKGRRDKNVDMRQPAHRLIYASWAEHPNSKRWTKARLLSSRARLIVALGFTAEYGLVRLLSEMGMHVRDSVTGHLWRQRKLRVPENWTYGYPGPSLSSRYSPASWWIIEEPTGGKRWVVVPVAHPSSWAVDPGYCRSKALIHAARNSIERITER